MILKHCLRNAGLLLLLISDAICGAEGIYGQNSEISRILNAWRGIAEQPFYGTVSVAFVDTESGVRKPTFIYRIQSGDDCCVLEEQYPSETPSLLRVKGVNSVYAFQLRRNASNQQYFAEDVIQRNHGEEAVNRYLTILATAKKSKSLNFLPFSALSIVGSKGFKITSIEDLTTNGRNVIEIRFDFSGQPEDSGQASKYEIRGGLLTLSNDRHFLPLRMTGSVRKTDVASEPDFEEIRYWNDYEITEGRAPRLTRQSLEIPGRNYMREALFEYENVGQKVECDQCRLTAYGLPEPVFVTSGGDRTWVWMTLGFGILCIAVGSAVLRKMRRS